jgi:hypothetical protein
MNIFRGIILGLGYFMGCWSFCSYCERRRVKDLVCRVDLS